MNGVKVVCVWHLVIVIAILNCRNNSAVAQHSTLYSQYMFNGLAINPAYAGNRECLSAAAVYRHQWVNFDGAPVTKNLSLHSPLKNKKIALGLNLTSDVLGISSATECDLSYAYRIKTSTGSTISLGLSAGLSWQKNNWLDIKTTDGEDAVFTGNTASILAKFGFGVYYSHKKYYTGVSFLNLSRPTNRGNAMGHYLQQPIMATAGYNIPIHAHFLLKPSVLMKYFPGNVLEVDINSLLTYGEKITLGFSYRKSSAIVAILQYQINDQLLIGYAFDYSTTSLRKYNSGSHEIVVRYDFKYSSPTVNHKSFE